MRYATIRGTTMDVNDDSVHDKMVGFCCHGGCQAPVVAFKGSNSYQLGGTGQRFHYRHARGYGKGCCYDGVSPLHDFAEHCLGRSGGMIMPDWDFEGRTVWEAFTAPVRFEEIVRLGRKEAGFRRPDVVTAFRSGKLAIEITVRCALTPQRILDLHNAGYRILEVMLTDMSLVDFDEDEVWKRVVEGGSDKFWRTPVPSKARRFSPQRVSFDEEVAMAASQCDLFERVPSHLW